MAWGMAPSHFIKDASWTTLICFTSNANLLIRISHVQNFVKQEVKQKIRANSLDVHHLEYFILFSSSFYIATLLVMALDSP